MNTKTPIIWRARAALLTALLSLTATFVMGESEFREFANSEGKVIKARLVAATADTAKLQMENGREVEAGVAYFSKADQDYIAEWRKTNKPAIDYQFEVDYTKKRASREVRNEGPVEVTYEKWFYDVEVENLSKVELDGLELHFKIYKTAKADANEAAYRAEGIVLEGPFLVRKGKVDLKPIPHLKSVKAETETMTTSKSQLDANYIYIDGEDSNKKDDLDGLWLKLFHNGKEVYEVKSSHAAVKNAKW